MADRSARQRVPVQRSRRLNHLRPRQIVALRCMALTGYAAAFGDRRTHLSLARHGLAITAERGFVLLPLHRGLALGAMVDELADPSGEPTQFGARILRTWRRRLEAEFPRLADDVRRAEPEWVDYLGRVRK